MSQLPARPDLDQLRRQARELHRSALGGDPDALRRLPQGTGTVGLSAAQLAIAREHQAALLAARRLYLVIWHLANGLPDEGHLGQLRAFNSRA
jgi:hypothetical protein